MSKSALIALTAVAVICGGVVTVAHAVGSEAEAPAQCTSRPVVTDKGARQQTEVACRIRNPRATATTTVTITATATVTVTATATVTATPNATPSPSQTPSPTPTPSPTATPSPTLTPSQTPTPTPTPTEPPSGDFPNASNTGVPPGTVLTPYTGPCTITTAGTVIDAKTINCVEFQVSTIGVVVKNSKINGVVRVGVQDDYDPTDISDPEGDDPIRVTILDSEIDATAAAGRGFRPISSSHYIVRNSYLHGAGSGAECHNACTIEGSYVHGFGEHASGLRILRNGTMRGNTIWCEPNHNSDEDGDGVPDPDGGCSGNLVMYEEFGVPRNNLVEGNYFPAGLFWYNLKFNGSDAGTIRIVDNTFGIPKPGAGVADDWDAKATNVWSGNTYTNGPVASP